jgi:hypothetical protein
LESELRACVAYIAGRLVSGRSSSSVYDYSQSKHTAIAGTVTNRQVAIYDYERGAYISGGAAQFYDYDEGCYISLQLTGNNFRGFDYGSASHFSGSVNGRNILMFDYEKGSHFQYSI